MKKLFTIVMLMVVATLAGCDNKEIGTGTNQDLTKAAKVIKYINSDNDINESYGKVVHNGKLANKVIVQGIQITPDMAGVNLVAGTRKDPMIISFICDSRAHMWGMTHNITVDGKEPEGVTEISIMNYREGLTEIREVDEEKPVFSTANGDTNIAEGLKRIGKLDPDSTVAIVLDREASDGYYDGVAWSFLMKVEDVVDGLRNVNLDVCSRSALPKDVSPEIIYTSTEQLRQGAKAMQEQ